MGAAREWRTPCAYDCNCGTTACTWNTPTAARLSTRWARRRPISKRRWKSGKRVGWEFISYGRLCGIWCTVAKATGIESRCGGRDNGQGAEVHMIQLKQETKSGWCV